MPGPPQALSSGLSDKTARAEFGLTQDEIIAAIRAGKLQYRRAEIEGNPWLRLLRREVDLGHGINAASLVRRPPCIDA